MQATQQTPNPLFFVRPNTKSNHPLEQNPTCSLASIGNSWRRRRCRNSVPRLISAHSIKRTVSSQQIPNLHIMQRLRRKRRCHIILRHRPRRRRLRNCNSRRRRFTLQHRESRRCARSRRECRC
ncbi:hypothetical protein K491DRAFT_434862 [Lophiostoma macrostomum CBS 122681]|uniref:Uncharacterized protein n=1 Tax=Lophiostoma macrostomum CBS 122681 TaxID=1314788 RepID=A0A6A6T5C6_9PLEO|nr:hypothetical protein K491DRAFT_434862 [Lophiostoma macrostomum CBS 122681]